MGGPHTARLQAIHGKCVSTSTIRRQMAKPNIIAGVISELVQISVWLRDKENLLSQAAVSKTQSLHASIES